MLRHWIPGAVFCFTLAAALALAAVRSLDGPLGILPGGPFRSGVWTEQPPAWDFVTSLEEVELESDGRSRTVRILVEAGRAYIPCSLSFPPGKRWHLAALESPDAVLRIGERRYRARLARVDDESLRSRLFDVKHQKYSRFTADDPDGAWYFRVDAPRGTP